MIGNILGWMYIAPPVKLVYRGFGEIVTMIGAGFIIPAFGYFVVMGRIDASFVLLSVLLLFYGFVLSFYLEIPARDADRKGKKNTIDVSCDDLGFSLIYSY